MFDAVRFLRDNFKHPNEVVAFFNAYGQDPPNESAVDKWFRRGALPAPWGYTLLVLMELDRGAPVSLAKYIGRGE